MHTTSTTPLLDHFLSNGRDLWTNHCSNHPPMGCIIQQINYKKLDIADEKIRIAILKLFPERTCNAEDQYSVSIAMFNDHKNTTLENVIAVLQEAQV